MIFSGSTYATSVQHHLVVAASLVESGELKLISCVPIIAPELFWSRPMAVYWLIGACEPEISNGGS